MIMLCHYLVSITLKSGNAVSDSGHSFWLHISFFHNFQSYLWSCFVVFLFIYSPGEGTPILIFTHIWLILLKWWRNGHKQCQSGFSSLKTCIQNSIFPFFSPSHFYKSLFCHFQKEQFNCQLITRRVSEWVSEWFWTMPGNRDLKWEDCVFGSD